MKAKEFDKKFDEGEDISSTLDLSGTNRPEQLNWKQLKIIDLFGTVEYDDDYDYKRSRNRG